jgi:radical SAM superfamily enzyme YgiQ (UPF0313 family)
VPAPKKYPVVLVADRTLMAPYQILFEGMLAASQTTSTPRALLNLLVLPRARSSNGRAPRAPLGLRRIEAACLAGGLSPDDVAIVGEDQLEGAIGPDTRVVGISSGEPAGRGMNSSTMTAVTGGRILPEDCFLRLVRRVRSLVEKSAPGAKVVLGGPGAWQARQDPAARQAAGADHVVTGYAEGNAAGIFKSLLGGESPPDVISGLGARPEEIPPIRGASTMGVVELSRGCGLGCHFCTMAREPMLHLPPETVLSDARTNIAAGQRNIAILSEDFFRYGGSGGRPQPSAVLSLLGELRRIDGLRMLQIDHANLSTVERWSDEDLESARRLLTGETGHRFLWVNVGVETASGELLRANGGKGKMGGVRADQWGDYSAEQVRRLIRSGFFPLVSLVIGLPGETREDVLRTIDWVRSFRDERLAVFPVLYAPIDGTSGLDGGALGPEHWSLLRASYRLNFRWVPKLYWDNQRAAGVPLARRILVQAFGRGQIVQWWTLLAWKERRSRRRMARSVLQGSGMAREDIRGGA